MLVFKVGNISINPQAACMYCVIKAHIRQLVWRQVIKVRIETKPKFGDWHMVS